jgi:hypothetical protein
MAPSFAYIGTFAPALCPFSLPRENFAASRTTHCIVADRQMELGIVTPALYGGLTVSGNPKLPATSPLEPLRPFGWPGVRAISHAMEPSRDAGEQLPWWKPDM